MTVEEMKELEERESKIFRNGILDVDMDMDLKLDFPKNLHMRFFNRDEMIKDGTIDVDQSTKTPAKTLDTAKPVSSSIQSIEPINQKLAPIGNNSIIQSQNVEDVKDEQNIDVSVPTNSQSAPTGAPLPGQI